MSSVDFAGGPNESVCLASRKCPDGSYERAKIQYPTLPVHFVGTGDLFTALITAWLKHGNFDIRLVRANIKFLGKILHTVLKYIFVKKFHLKKIQFSRQKIATFGFKKLIFSAKIHIFF